MEKKSVEILLKRLDGMKERTNPKKISTKKVDAYFDWLIKQYERKTAF